MNLRWPLTFRQALLSLIFSLSFMGAAHPSALLTEGLGVEEMIVALTEKSPLEVQDHLAKNGGVASARLSAVGKANRESVNAAESMASVNRGLAVAAVESMEPAQATAAAVKTDSPTVNANPTNTNTNTIPTAPPAASNDLPQVKPPISTVQVAVPNANAPAGTVKQVRGEVTLARANASTKIVEGETLNEGDTISTAVDASLMVQLSDDAKLLIRGNSTVRLTRIVNTGAVEKRSQSIELALGALRFVTGAIGKLRPENVSFKTPVATVGIRGTDLDIVHTVATRGLQAAGTYVRVNTGEVELNGNDGSQIALSKDEQAVATRLGAPLRGGGRAPATKKLEVPANVFTTSEMDSLLEGGGR